ncbi:Ferroportin1-domain-containing protein [Xylariaceae sp. FL0255]|nr:Ferroportin1-domain-containing protein [Xylariaceae sp. FL0255]
MESVDEPGMETVDVSTEEDTNRPELSRAQANGLYLSHIFSTWNARGYEFAAVLFTAAAYPDTLVAAALRMIIIYFAMIMFSPSVGQWVQHSPSRLKTLMSTIVCNRGSVIIGSFFWLLILSQENLIPNDTTLGKAPVFTLPQNDALKGITFAIAVTFGIIERLSASGNLISMERDWVVTAAAPTGHRYDLTNMNALLSPILISIVISATGSVRIGVLYTGLTSLVSIPIELLSAKRVWSSCAVLQAPKPSYFRGLDSYFRTEVWIPSVALALLHFNVLTWRATFITYLISIGYSLNVITIARAAGSIFEISSTIITPRGIVYFGKHSRRATLLSEDVLDESGVSLLRDTEEVRGSDKQIDDAQTIVGLQRLGLWGMSAQLINTIPVVLALWAISKNNEDQNTPESITTSASNLSIGWSLILFSFLAVSRLGVWIFDLTTQQLSQTLVAPSERSTFAGVENSVVNVFEVLGAGAAVIFPHPEQFRWLALASLIGVTISWAMYCFWVRSQRGHLLHWDRLPKVKGWNG